MEIYTIAVKKDEKWKMYPVYFSSEKEAMERLEEMIKEKNQGEIKSIKKNRKVRQYYDEFYGSTLTFRLNRMKNI